MPEPEREHILSKDCWCGPRVDFYSADDVNPDDPDLADDEED